eukprot:gene4633-5240_t
MRQRTYNIKTYNTKLITSILLISSMILDRCNSITLLSRSSSYAVYPPWPANVTGRLEFRFKTSNPNSLLLYIEEENNEKDRDDKSYLQVSLQQGAIKLEVQMGGTDFWSKKHRVFGLDLNDLEWHSVEIKRKRRSTTLKIDQWSFNIINTGMASTLPINSSVYVGGLPNQLRRKVVNGRVFYTPRFVGCIDDLAYSVGDKPVKPYHVIRAEKVTRDCVDACKTHKNRNCANGGKCKNRFSTIVCDCLGTGFEGRNCTTPSPSAYFRGVEYLAWTPARSQSTPSHHIVMRFKTYMENGILFSTVSKKDFLIIELHDGEIRIVIDLGGGPLEMKVGHRKLNDQRWHKLEIKRTRTFMVTNVDDISIKNGTTPGRNSNFDIPYYESMYFGGYRNPRQLQRSKSKQNFAGCMQHVTYNNVDILFKKFETLSTQIVSSGYVQKGCPVSTSTVPLTSTIQFTTLKDSTTHGSTSTKEKSTKKPISSNKVVTNGNPSPTNSNNVYGKQNGSAYRKASLSKSQIAWITSGIIVGALFLVFTTACLFHKCKKRYDGFLLSSTMKNKDTQLRPSQRYKGERVVFLENATKEKLDKITVF